MIYGLYTGTSKKTDQQRITANVYLLLKNSEPSKHEISFKFMVGEVIQKFFADIK